jgi:cell division initiation protein
MKLTPLDIRHKEFKRGMRGYTDAEVDEFLDQVADEFERLFKENIELSDRVEALQEQISHYRTLEDTLQKTLITAQQSAEEVKSSAQKEAGLILRDADLRARDMVGDAERKARDLVNEAFANKQTVEKEIVLLRNAEADFRFKFRQLLEGYLQQVGGEDVATRERADEFARQAEELKAAIEAERPPLPRPAAPAAPAEAPAAPAPPEDRPPAPEPAPPVVGRHWWEPSPEEEEAARTEGTGASAAEEAPSPPQPQGHTDEGEDTEALEGPGSAAAVESADESEGGEQAAGPGGEEASPAAGPVGADDEFLADVDDRVGDDEFKW